MKVVQSFSCPEIAEGGCVDYGEWSVQGTFPIQSGPTLYFLGDSTLYSLNPSIEAGP